MSKSFLRFVLLSSPLLLGACGEGWEVKRIDDVQPYKSRTAGTGVAYVLAKMMPEKELKLEPVAEVPEQKQEEVQPVLDAEEIFNDAQGKGRAAEKPDEGAKNSDDMKEEKHGKAKSEMVVPVEKHSLLNEEQGEALEGDVIKTASVQSSAELNIPELSAEEFIEQAPKSVEIPELEVREIEAMSVEDEQVEHVVEVYENTVAEPEKELMTPKKDFFDIRSVGQENLDEIYKDPF